MSASPITSVDPVMVEEEPELGVTAQVPELPAVPAAPAAASAPPSAAAPQVEREAKRVEAPALSERTVAPQPFKPMGSPAFPVYPDVERLEGFDPPDVVAGSDEDVDYDAPEVVAAGEDDPNYDAPEVIAGSDEDNDYDAPEVIAGSEDDDGFDPPESIAGE